MWLKIAHGENDIHDIHNFPPKDLLLGRKCFFCILCKVDCSSESHFDSHVKGKSHKNRRKMIAVCVEKFRQGCLMDDYCLYLVVGLT
jgi:hypothetical protein